MNDFGFNSNGFVRQFLDKPIATYTHTTNKEVAVSAVTYNADTPANTFTSVGHGLVDTDLIYPVLNTNAGVIFPIDKYPTGLVAGKYYVVNKTDNTFQISTSSGGAPVALTLNANLDLTKWHFEKFSAEVTISNLPSLKKIRVLVKGKVLHPSLGAYIRPNGLALATEWLKTGGTTYVYPDLALNGDVFINAEIIIDSNSYLIIKERAIRIKSDTVNANINALLDAIFVNFNSTAMSITSITTSAFVMANGTTLEVYRA